MAHGTCGDQFRAAFSCFVFSKEDPKGMDCIEHFKTMQGCFRDHPDEYGGELEDEEEMEAGDKMSHGSAAERSSGDGDAGDQKYASGEPMPEPARRGVQDADPQRVAPPPSQSFSSSSAPASATEPNLSNTTFSSPQPNDDQPTQRAKAVKAQVAQHHGHPLSESNELVPKAAHDAREPSRYRTGK